jgi:hypothetical protein
VGWVYSAIWSVDRNWILIKEWTQNDISESKLHMNYQVTTRNMDSDDRDEIIIVSSYCYVSDEQDNWLIDDAINNYQVINHWHLSSSIDNYVEEAKIVTMSFSTELQLTYTGNYYQTSNEPNILLVFTAPPYQWGLDSSYQPENAYVDCGIGVSGSSSVENGFSTTLSSGVSYDVVEIPEIFKASLTLTASAEWGTTGTHSTSTRSEVGWESYPHSEESDQDFVLYETINYMHYEYEVIKCDSDPSVEGEKIFIHTPLEQDGNLIWTEVANFNDDFADQGLYIGSETFDHTIGSIKSYPNRDELFDRVQGSEFWEKTNIVGDANAISKVSFDLSIEETTTISRVAGVEFGTEFEFPNWGFEASFGLFTSYAYSNTVGENSVFLGGVPSMDKQSTHDNFMYEFGLVIYTLNREEIGQSYKVADFYVNYNTPGYDQDNENTLSGYINAKNGGEYLDGVKIELFSDTDDRIRDTLLHF